KAGVSHHVLRFRVGYGYFTPYQTRPGMFRFYMDTLKRLGRRRVAQEPEQQLRAQSSRLRLFSARARPALIVAMETKWKKKCVGDAGKKSGGPPPEDRPLPELTL